MALIAPEKSNFFTRCNYNAGKADECHRFIVGQEQASKAAAHGHLALIEQAIAGLSKETKPRLRYAPYGHLSWRLEPYARATPEFGSPRRTSMRLPPHLS